MEKILKEIDEEIILGKMLECHSDGPGYNDHSGSDDHENWNNS